jgi:2-amino-4-hydroxy-6-hydroxymethyldihydropteridine diphosphokinase
VKKNSQLNIATLSFGSNQGEREWNILGAANAINDSKYCKLKRLSSLYETEPVGSGFSRTFINAVAVFLTSMKPLELLSLCKKLEKDFGRKVSGDRPLDIDIILYGEVVLKKDELTIPHPRFRERSFVIVPMLEICRDFTVAPDNMRVVDIAANMSSSQWVRKISSRYLIEKIQLY